MPTLFKNGVISKNGVNQGIEVPDADTDATGTVVKVQVSLNRHSLYKILLIAQALENIYVVRTFLRMVRPCQAK